MMVWYTNADQLFNKRDALSMAICGEEPDIIFVTEVLPKASLTSISLSMLSLPGYSLVTNIKFGQGQCGQGIRGVGIYIHEDVSATEVTFPGTQFQEQVWIGIKLQGNDILYAGCIYRSPSSDPHKSINELCELLRTVSSTKPSHLLLVGDFNLPQIDWKLNLCKTPESHYAYHFFSTIQDMFLYQHVTEPTRYREGCKPSLLDLILTNEEGMITSLTYCPGLGKSDHVLLKCGLACYGKINRPDRIKWSFNRANFQEFGRRIRQVNWSSLSRLGVNAGYQFFRDTLFSLQEECIPRGTGSKSRKNLYMTSRALHLKRQKHSLWSAYTHSQDPVDLARFKRCRNRLRGMTRQLRKDYEAHLVHSIKVNPKAFWKYANSRTKVRPGIGDLRDSEGRLESREEAKAAILNDFFAGVFTSENLSTIPDLSIRHTGPELTDVPISSEAVTRKLLALKPCSAPGPDEVHPRVLRELGHSLGHPLAMLYRRSLDTGILPPVWKQGMVVPIYKKGDKHDPGNYRPVSLTSVPCKILESLIRDELMQYLTTHNLLAEEQHGFRPGRSCNSQLLETIDAWSRLLESGTPIDVVYLDFKKAFDSVPHRRLLRKLQSYGISGKLLEWIESFLSGRMQQVTLGGCHSGFVPVTSGVPQGSVLGPLLFLLYVNDLPDIINCTVKLFADDAKLFAGVSSHIDAEAMQADLDALGSWSVSWQMTFNQDKCKVMHFGPQNTNSTFYMEGHQLDSTQVERDLGVQIDSALKFRQQGAAAVAKANQVLGLIRRSFSLIDEVTLPFLFKSLVRPHLEYGNLVWGPFNRADQKAIERVQRRATRLVTSIRHLKYQERLHILRLPSLYYRRRRGDMIHVYQMLHGGVDVGASDMFTLHTGGPTRGHSLKLCKPYATCRFRRTSFAVRVINDWNGLPDAIVQSPSLCTFKSRLDSYWEAHWYDIPDSG